MKKTLCIILALVMILSAVSYAAPVMVGTVENTVENAVETTEAVVENEALAEVTAEEGYNIPVGSKLVFDVPYNNGVAIANYQAVTKYGTYGADFNENGTVPSIVTGTNGNNKIYVDWGGGTAGEYASNSNTGFTSADNALAIKKYCNCSRRKVSSALFKSR